MNFRRSFIPLKPMDATPVRIAWEPLTPRGVAAFAHSPLRRLLLVQFIVALLVGVAFAWLLRGGFFPIVTAAIEQLPTEGEIRRATLDWRGNSPQVLAEGRFLSFAVDLGHSGEVRSLAHFQFEFGKTNVLVQSLLGYTSGGYPDGWVIALNRPELSPRWGAWRPMFLALTVVVVVAYLFASWLVLATLYCGPVWVLGFFTNRDLTLRACWKLAGAALMPGALAMLVVILLYGLGMLDLVHLGFALAVHVLLGWVYPAVSTFLAPQIGEMRANPFVPEKK
ncbi:MAG: hypothetical protein U1F83_01520 [Verrucomicrobiota bacterium]